MAMSVRVIPEDLSSQIDLWANDTVFCFQAVATTSAGVWLGDNPLNFSFPLLLYQISLIFVSSRLIHLLLGRVGVPIVISQILAGIFLGPSFLSRDERFEALLLARRDWEQLNTVGMLAFMLFIFMTGVKTDLGMIPRSGKKAVAIAIVGTCLPLAVTWASSHALRPFLPRALKTGDFLPNLATHWSLTSFTVLSCVLSELHLLTSKVGRLAMSASLIADFTNTFTTACHSAYVLGARSHSAALAFAFLGSFVLFLLFLLFGARPFTRWLIRRTPEGSLLGEASLVSVVMLALASGLVSDVIGYHATMGPFLLGLMLPGGAPLGVTLVERLERLVTGVFLPVFMATAGMRVDLAALREPREWGFTELFVMTCVGGKFVGVVLPCLWCKMPLRDAVSLGLIMASKGIYEVDNASQLHDSEAVDQQNYAVLILSIIWIGGGTAVLVKHLYRPEDRFIAYKRRTIQHTKPGDELRVLVGVHSQNNVNPILTLLEASRPTCESPVCIYVLHLVRLMGRADAVLRPYSHHPKAATATSESDHIINAFSYFEQQHIDCVSVLPYICMSPYDTMHDDVCSLALDKKADLVIMPCHRHVAVDGSIVTAGAAIHNINVNVLTYAPCSVAILIDRGLAPRAAAFTTGNDHLWHRIAVYFLGGADDREALAFASRMAGDPAVGIMVVRLRLPKEWREAGKEEALDNEAVAEFRQEREDGERVVYREEVVKDGEGTVGVIRETSRQFSLLVVGRRGGKESPITAGLSAWSEYPELGVIADLLASTDFGCGVSTLVVQQQTRFVGGGKGGQSPRSFRSVNQVVPHDED